MMVCGCGIDVKWKSTYIVFFSKSIKPTTNNYRLCQIVSSHKFNRKSKWLVGSLRHTADQQREKVSKNIQHLCEDCCVNLTYLSDSTLILAFLFGTFSSQSRMEGNGRARRCCDRTWTRNINTSITTQCCLSKTSFVWGLQIPVPGLKVSAEMAKCP